ncbi:MAG: ATP-binding protein [Bacteroidales bacterium]|nr:ATP-binding protein [Bacteroidales bacterium]
MIERVYLQRLTRRMNESRKFIQVLYGPRQVGKTTMILQLLSKIAVENIYETADTVAAADTRWLQTVWETARIKLKLSGAGELLLVIDEIQKIDNWSETVKKLWDEDSRTGNNIKVILLGSSSLLIQKGLTESLAGRFEKTYIGHWSFAEMQSAFGWDINQYIYFGGYPGAASLIDDEKRWKSYIIDSLIETSISKDILMLTRVDKPALLKRLFEIGTHYSGQILSFTKILGQLLDAGNTTTLSHYLSLLSNCGLLGGLEKFSGNIVKKRGSIPKFQLYNNALRSAYLKTDFLQTFQEPNLWGRIAESAVGTHLLGNAITENYKLYYWREGDCEIDFVIEYGEKILGLEVKSGVSTQNKGIGKFLSQYPAAKTMFVGTGGIPIEEFLNINPVELL